MANPHPDISNLKPANTKSKLENSKNGRLGGIKSGESKRNNKIIRKALEAQIGKKINDITNAILNKAAEGDVRAYEVIRDTLGEKPVNEMELTDNITFKVKFIGEKK
jgi:hypothetical protein